MMTDDTEHNYGWPRTSGARLALVLGLIFAATQLAWFTDAAQGIALAALALLGFAAFLALVLATGLWIARGEDGSEDPKNQNRDAGW